MDSTMTEKTVLKTLITNNMPTQSKFKRKLELAKADERKAKTYLRIAKMNLIIFVAVAFIAAMNMHMVIRLHNLIN